jgi:hypothetical protein
LRNLNVDDEVMEKNANNRVLIVVARGGESRKNVINLDTCRRALAAASLLVDLNRMFVVVARLIFSTAEEEFLLNKTKNKQSKRDQLRKFADGRE